MSTESLQTIGRIWPFLLIAVLLVAAFIVVIMSSMVRKSAPPTAGKSGGDDPDHVAAPPPEPGSSDSRLPAGPLGRSFSQAGQFLKANSAGRDYRYQVPWFMVAGRAGSGKSSLLASLGSGILF